MYHKTRKHKESESRPHDKCEGFPWHAPRAVLSLLTDPSWSVSTKKGPDHIQRPEKVCKKDRKALSPQPSPVKQKMKMSANFHVPIKKQSYSRGDQTLKLIISFWWCYFKQAIRNESREAHARPVFATPTALRDLSIKQNQPKKPLRAGCRRTTTPLYF